MSTTHLTDDQSAPTRGVRDTYSGDETAHRTFLTGLAHDLRQVLTAISGTAQLTERRIGAAPVALGTTFAALGGSRNAASRMAQRLADREEFAIRRTDQVPAMEPRPMDLSAIARQTLARYARSAIRGGSPSLGTLSLGSRRQGSFEQEELDLLRTVSDLVAAAFDRAELAERLAVRAEGLARHARSQASLLNAISQAVIVTDSSGSVTLWNQAAETLYGWSEAEALGHPVFELTVPEAGSDDANAIMNALTRGKTWSGEFMVRRRDGMTFLARVTNSPVHDDAGQFIGVIGLSEDLTGERQRELAVQAEQERRSEWLRFASHELRGPLTSIIGYSSRLRRHASENAELAAIGQEIDLLASEAARMERSTDLVLRVAALDAGTVRLEHEPLYLADLVSEEVARMLHREPTLEVSVNLVGDDISLTSDAGAIGLILRNLLENAVKYGGKPPAVSIAVESGLDLSASVTVSDNGPGIPQDDLQHIFDRYFRGLASLSGSPGLGLGLYISARLACLLGGTLGADSQPGGGAVFRLVLPQE